jgi:hypothetical protein
MTYTLDIRTTDSGPIFDGRAEAAAHDWAEATVKELAAVGADWIRIAANEMDKSGRGGTGRAAAGVVIYDHGLTQTIYGEQKEGEVWWPWLEGISKRNDSTRFGGYHTFRTTRRRLTGVVQTVADAEFRKFAPAMGGD